MNYASRQQCLYLHINDAFGWTLVFQGSCPRGDASDTAAPVMTIHVKYTMHDTLLYSWATLLPGPLNHIDGKHILKVPRYIRELGTRARMPEVRVALCGINDRQVTWTNFSRLMLS